MLAAPDRATPLKPARDCIGAIASPPIAPSLNPGPRKNRVP
jgi:hypothetical protein